MNDGQVMPDLVIDLRTVDKRKFPCWNDAIKESRSHWSGANKMESGLRDYFRHLANSGKMRKHTGRVRFMILFFEPDKRRDPDGIEYFKKPFLDGLRDAAVIQNDAIKDVAGFITEFYVDRQYPRIEVYIKSADNNPEDDGNIGRLKEIWRYI